MLRDRRLGRIWRDREPAAYLEPFNLLHRNQMMENEPPEHTRLRRAVAGAFNRGHVERLRPRVQSLAAVAARRGRPGGFDVIGEYAEPLPVLVIAELVGLSGADVPVAAALVAGDRADVRAGAVAGGGRRRRDRGRASSPTSCASTSTGGAPTRRTT